ncbi:MAG: hypothetical protein GWP08_15940, partial [Nitrospiraceae bacterium]|nr:hypothetical protein [Nitrospiraceae bacterium]
MRELLGSFIRSFHKAIRGEMDAMRKRLGPFEVPLKNARRPDASGDGPCSSAGNLLNVSISRARGKLIIVADVNYFARRAPKSVLNAILKQAAAGGLKTTLSREH